VVSLTLLGTPLAALADDGYATLYATKSNSELTALSEQWHALDAEQRRALLTEVQSRVIRTQNSGTMAMRFRAQRRYGRIVRKADGSVRVETRVVEIRGQARPEARNSTAQQGFGVGFEQRAAQRDDLLESVPAVKVQQER
jgi:hypothetical protein